MPRFACPHCQKQMEMESGSVATIVACPHCAQELEIPAAELPLPPLLDGHVSKRGNSSKPTLAPPHPDDTVRVLQAVEFRLQKIEAYVGTLASRPASSGGLQGLGIILLLVSVVAALVAMGSSAPGYLSEKNPTALLEELLEATCRGIGVVGFLLAILLGTKSLELLSGR